MKNFSRNLNVVLTTALVFAILLTLIGPFVIRLLFTPPVSFGTNCEPAAAWALHSLIWAQIVALIVGGLTGFIFIFTRKSAAKVESTPKS